MQYLHILCSGRAKDKKEKTEDWMGVWRRENTMSGEKSLRMRDFVASDYFSSWTLLISSIDVVIHEKSVRSSSTA